MNMREFLSKLHQSIFAPGKAAESEFQFNGGFAYLDKSRQLKVGLRIFNDALAGKSNE